MKPNTPKLEPQTLEQARGDSELALEMLLSGVVAAEVSGFLLLAYGLWFMVYELWSAVYGLWFEVYGLWFTVDGVKFSVQSSGFRGLGGGFGPLVLFSRLFLFQWSTIGAISSTLGSRCGVVSAEVLVSGFWFVFFGLCFLVSGFLFLVYG